LLSCFTITSTGGGVTGGSTGGGVTGGSTGGGVTGGSTGGGVTGGSGFIGFKTPVAKSKLITAIDAKLENFIHPSLVVGKSGLLKRNNDVHVIKIIKLM